MPFCNGLGIGTVFPQGLESRIPERVGAWGQLPKRLAKGIPKLLVAPFADP